MSYTLFYIKKNPVIFGEGSLFLSFCTIWASIIFKLFLLASCQLSPQILVYSIGLLLLYIHFGAVIKHVLHSLDFLLWSPSVSNCRKTCNEMPHVIIWSRASIVLKKRVEVGLCLLCISIQVYDTGVRGPRCFVSSS